MDHMVADRTGCVPMPSTISEQVFERFCRDRQLRFDRVRGGQSKSADYLLYSSDAAVVVEVKQIEPNQEERRVLTIPEDEWDGELVYHWGIPGEKIRKKIVDAMPQLKAISRGSLPTLLIIYDTIRVWPELTDGYAVRTAMFGIETALVSAEVAPEGGAKVLAKWYGGRRRLTAAHNTSLSAIGILACGPEAVTLDVYHNPHTKSELPVKALSVAGVRQFRLADDPAHGFANWIEERL